MKESSKPLALASTDYQSDDIVEAIVFLQDLSHDAVMETFADRYPEECALYVFVKECDEPLTSEDIDSDMLDAAISHKRQIYREAYAEWNQLFVEKFSGAIDIVFTSFYSPMVLVRAPYHFINDIERDDMVTEVAICPPTEYSNESLAIANTMTRADYVRDTCGNRGSNVKIGLVEYMGKPDVTDSYLTNAAITICPTPISGVTTLSHSTIIARILVGTSATTASDGFAPDAQLFCSSFTGNNDLYNAIEWLISSDVCVINASINVGEEGVYGAICKWIDHLAITHDVHFVTSSGNMGNNQSYMITAPGLAYNAITVGGYDPGSETQWNYTTQPIIWGNSRYGESGTEYPEKPNLVADCIDFWSSYGTSFAAPQVAGVIAQLCSYNSTLKVKQTAIGAILMASAARKVDADNNGKVGSTFNSSVQVTGSSQISNQAGAGVLDARWAREIVSSGKYWTPTVYDNGFPYSKTVTLSADTNTSPDSDRINEPTKKTETPEVTKPAEPTLTPTTTPSPAPSPTAEPTEPIEPLPVPELTLRIDGDVCEEKLDDQLRSVKDVDIVVAVAVGFGDVPPEEAKEAFLQKYPELDHHRLLGYTDTVEQPGELFLLIPFSAVTELTKDTSVRTVRKATLYNTPNNDPLLADLIIVAGTIDGKNVYDSPNDPGFRFMTDDERYWEDVVYSGDLLTATWYLRDDEYVKVVVVPTTRYGQPEERLDEAWKESGATDKTTWLSGAEGQAMSEQITAELIRDSLQPLYDAGWNITEDGAINDLPFLRYLCAIVTGKQLKDLKVPEGATYRYEIMFDGLWRNELPLKQEYFRDHK